MSSLGDGERGGVALEAGGYHQDPSNHHRYLSGVALKITSLLVVVAVTFLLLNRAAYPIEIFQRSYSFSGTYEQNQSSSPISCNGAMQHSVLSPANEEEELERTLGKAAMKDKKTVIITTLNAAWAQPNSLFDLFLESFRIGNGTRELLNHVLVGAFDRMAYSRCLAENLHCYAITTQGIDFSGEAFFMSEDYLKMMWRRLDFLGTVLELGYDFVFTDTDIMWFRDPFPRFYPDGEFQIACDHYRYNYTNLHNSPNAGFKYVKSNNRTIQFYKYWYSGRDYFPGKNEQVVLNKIKFYPFLQDIGLEIRFLDTIYFSGFCEPNKDMDLVITMHANCCVGIKRKIHDIKMVINDWKRYMSLPGGVERNMSSRSWTVPRICH